MLDLSYRKNCRFFYKQATKGFQNVSPTFLAIDTNKYP